MSTRIKPIGSNQTEVRRDNGTVVLVSYETPVAAYIPGRGYVRTENYYSQTTSKHINRWLGGKVAERVPHWEIDALL